jgi:hypothetical protein
VFEMEKKSTGIQKKNQNNFWKKKGKKILQEVPAWQLSNKNTLVLKKTLEKKIKIT